MAERGRSEKTTSWNGQAWNSASPRGQGRTAKMEKTGFKIIRGAPTTLAVKALMMMMMIRQVSHAHRRHTHKVRETERGKCKGGGGRGGGDGEGMCE